MKPITYQCLNPLCGAVFEEPALLRVRDRCIGNGSGWWEREEYQETCPECGEWEMEEV